MNVDAVFGIGFAVVFIAWSAVTLVWARLMQKAAGKLAAAAIASREQADEAWSRIKKRCDEWNEAMALHRVRCTR